MFLFRIITIITISVCILSCGRASESPPERSAEPSVTSFSQKLVKVVRANSTRSNISPSEVDSNLAAVNEILRTDDGLAMNGDGDFSCPIEIIRDGNISVSSSSAAPNIVGNESDFNRVCGVTAGFIHVVDRILWCGGDTRTDGSIRGCSDLQGSCIVVTRPEGVFTPDLEGILWAHEYVHTKGEADSCMIGCISIFRDRLMHPVIAINHRKIGQNEYNAIMR